MDKILITENDFNLCEEISMLKDSNIGAVVSFVGFVRDIASDKIDKMVIECYEQMTKKSLSSIVNKAKSKFDIEGVSIVHRVGDLKVSEQIVMVAVSSKHRSDGFGACHFIMDYLKTDAPFWKKEYKKSGADWVLANTKDIKEKDKWY